MPTSLKVMALHPGPIKDQADLPPWREDDDDAEPERNFGVGSETFPWFRGRLLKIL